MSIVLGKAYKKGDLVYIPCGSYYKNIYNVRVYSQRGDEMMLLREEKLEDVSVLKMEPTHNNFFLQAVKENVTLSLKKDLVK